jgi:CRP/FNR family transcriptional regulator
LQEEMKSGMESNIMNSQQLPLDVFPCLNAVRPEEWAEAQPFTRTFPAKTRIFAKEDAAKYGMFLLRGSALITLIGENGSESVLNVLSAGEVCALLVLSGLSGRDYPGSLIAETEVEALFVSRSSFLRWVQEHEPIRSAVFGGLLEGMLRMSELLQARQTEPLDARLARALLRGTSEKQPLLHATHQELAAEIGSAREVVTRALRRFQQNGWVETGRGWVRVTGREELEAELEDRL